MNINEYLAHIAFCLRRLTRLSLPADPAVDGTRFSTAAWAYPVVGAAIGGLGAIAYWLSQGFGLPVWIAAVIAIAVMVTVTGAAPERALSRAAAITRPAADGSGGEGSAGEWGTIALVLTLAVKIGVLVALGSSAAVGAALVGAGALGHAALVSALFLTPGPDIDVEAEPSPISVASALGLAVVIALIVLPAGWFWGFVLALVAAGLIIWSARRRSGEQARIMVGAVLPVVDLLVLLAVAAAL